MYDTCSVEMVQINPVVGDLHGNTKKILHNIATSNSNNGRLVIMPELVLVGYPPRDLLLCRDFVRSSMEFLHRQIAPQITDPNLCVILGGLDVVDDRLYNAAHVIYDGRVQHTTHKKLLPNYEVFNESRYFAAGTGWSDVMVTDALGRRIALFICEDMLGLEDGFSGYANPPDLRRIAATEPELAVCIAASPYRLGQHHKRKSIISHFSQELGCPVALVNQCGANDNIIFDGGGLLVDGDRTVLDSPSMLRHHDETTELHDALVVGIRDYCTKTNFGRVYIGLSGGIDSALVACLAVHALGADHVYGLLMPSEYSSPGSIADAQQLADALGIHTQTLPISDILRECLASSHLNKLTLAEENLQSRIRGMLLMAMANNNNALALATSNKSELAVGYFTLYGDSCGALAPIGDLWKSQVYALAAAEAAIPPQILTKPPSAELRPGQQDADSLPPYELLDRMLIDIVEQRTPMQTLQQKYHNNQPELTKTLKLLAQSEFKRKQAPPILKVSKQSFGSDWQMPIAATPMTYQIADV